MVWPFFKKSNQIADVNLLRKAMAKDRKNTVDRLTSNRRKADKLLKAWKTAREKAKSVLVSGYLYRGIQRLRLSY